jgi:dethiobiotin synthetase
MRVFVSGIGTGVGKTIVSAILAEALGAAYWKPVQAGDLDSSDTLTVQRLSAAASIQVFPEAFALNHPMSPHAAAALDGVRVDIASLMQAYSALGAEHLVVEGAGGLMVPLNERELMIDLVQQMGIPVVLVSRNYLGSINHTLLSAEALQRRNIPVAGIVFNGAPVPSTEQLLLDYTGLPCIVRVEEEPRWDREVILKYAARVDLKSLHHG